MIPPPHALPRPRAQVCLHLAPNCKLPIPLTSECALNSAPSSLPISSLSPAASSSLRVRRDRVSERDSDRRRFSLASSSICGGKD